MIIHRCLASGACNARPFAIRTPQPGIKSYGSFVIPVFLLNDADLKAGQSFPPVQPHARGHKSGSMSATGLSRLLRQQFSHKRAQLSIPLFIKSFFGLGSSKSSKNSRAIGKNKSGFVDLAPNEGFLFFDSSSSPSILSTLLTRYR
jgi:hypothetical protein